MCNIINIFYLLQVTLKQSSPDQVLRRNPVIGHDCPPGPRSHIKQNHSRCKAN